MRGARPSLARHATRRPTDGGTRTGARRRGGAAVRTFSMGMRPSVLSRITSTDADMTCAPVPCGRGDRLNPNAAARGEGLKG
eukprot:766825-Prymnesium_polylepis.1